MGIFCQINIFNPSNRIYHRDQNVSGIIKYSLDEPMLVDKVLTSLKGIGYIAITVSPGSFFERTYKTEEVFVDVDTVIHGEKTELSVGTHEIKFNYTLPDNIPSALKSNKPIKFKDYKIKFYVKYYIRIKFKTPGVFAFNKHFRKEINVISKIVPTLPREPAIYENTKKLLRIFSNQDSLVSINATVFNSVLPIGGKIEVHYKVQNNSHVVIKSTMTKLVQNYIFKSKGYRRVTYEEHVPDTEAQTLRINCQETQSRSININVPINLYSVSNTQLVSRYYEVRIIAQLPIPYKNVFLNVPIQIGDFYENVDVNRSVRVNPDLSNNDQSPTYWEVMGEASANQECDDSDDEADTTKLFDSVSDWNKAHTVP